MDVQYLSQLVSEFCYSPYRHKRWQLAQPFKFSVDGQVFVIPAGFWTDFASVPRVLWSLISPYDLGIGPVPHDFGYFIGYRDKSYWDLVFQACMEKDQVERWKRNAAYIAVDWFGWSAWKQYRKANTKHQLHRVGSTRQMEVISWSVAPKLLCGKATALTNTMEELTWKTQVELLTTINQ